jgi:Tfp pilus assembly protein PilP
MTTYSATAPRPRLALALALLACLALVVTACGKSKEQKAMDSVCSARADINKQVNHLKGLTPSTATLGDVQKSVQAIGNDLSKITDAQGDLKGDRKTQVQNANAQFKSQLQGIVKTVGRSLSVGQAKTQATQALQALATAYKKSLAPINCS